MPVKTIIEERIKEAEDIVKKLYEDIEDLQKRRDNIQNEVNAALEEAKKKSDALHLARMVQLDHEYEKKRADQDAKEKYLDDYMVRLDRHATELSAQKISQDKNSVELEATIKLFNSQKDEAVKQIKDGAAANERVAGLNEEEAKRLKALEQELSAKTTDQAKVMGAISARYEALSAKEAGIAVLITQNEKILENISDKQKSIKEESILIRESLDAIEAKKQELIKLSAIKDDLLKLDADRQALEDEKKKVKKWSDNVEARDKTVSERELTATEKEKYITIMGREVDGKIALLKRIRAGENA